MLAAADDLHVLHAPGEHPQQHDEHVPVISGQSHPWDLKSYRFPYQEGLFLEILDHTLFSVLIPLGVLQFTKERSGQYSACACLLIDF